MFSFIPADWLKIGRHWLPWLLLGLLLLILPFQVNGKLERITHLEESPSGRGADVDRQEIEWLRGNLRYPAVIGYAARRATDLGWFFLILLTAVTCGEDFTRQTLRGILARGIGRGNYLAARCLSLWLAAGVALLAVTLLAAASGPAVHARVSDDPISLAGLGEALLVPLRVWLTCLPFIAATLFWAVLARQAGLAMGVGVGLHAYGFLSGMVLPVVAASVAIGAEFPPIYRWQIRLLSVTLSYNADVLIYWGSPLMEAIFVFSTPPPIDLVMELGGGSLLPAAPWRAALFLVGYTGIFLGWAIWILRRRDVTYEA